MRDAAAIKAALQILHMPAKVRSMREAPLPSGLHAVLQIASGNKDAIQAAQALTGRETDKLVSAARFYIEQVLWHPDADHFRVLGADISVSNIVLKRNMTLLMTWLHPDIATSRTHHSAYAARITAAWNDLKTPERRQAYEALVARQQAIAAQRQGQFNARIEATRGRSERRRARQSPLWNRIWRTGAGRPDA